MSTKGFLDIVHGKYRFSYRKKKSHHKKKSHTKRRRRRSRRTSKRKFGNIDNLIAKARKASMSNSSPSPSLPPPLPSPPTINNQYIPPSPPKNKGQSVLSSYNRKSIFDDEDDEPKSDNKSKDTSTTTTINNNIEDKAMKFADMIDMPGQYEYIYYVFNKKPNLTPDKFMNEISEGKHPNLLSPLANPGLIDNGQSRKQRINQLLDDLDELKDYVPAPPLTEKYFKDAIKYDSDIDKGKGNLARNMALYSRMTNRTKPLGKTRYKELGQRWGYELGMSQEDIDTNLIPFLQEMLPVMEEPNQQWEL